MAKYVTRKNPVSIVTVKTVNPDTETFESVSLNIIDLPAVGENANRRNNAIKAALKKEYPAAMFISVQSVTEGNGFYRMEQDKFIANAEFVPDDSVNETETE